MALPALADDTVKIASRRIGPALLFERLWAETGCQAAIVELAGARKHGFALEPAVFLTVLHRLFVSGSDRAADRWRADYYRIAGIDGLNLHQLYRAMAWLGEELPAKDQDRRVRAPLRQGSGGRAAIRTSARPVHAPRFGIHRHHQGSSARSAPDDPHRSDRWRRSAGVLGDVAGQHPDVMTLTSVIDRLRRRFARACAWSPIAA